MDFDIKKLIILKMILFYKISKIKCLEKDINLE